MRPIPLNNSAYSDSMCCLNDSSVTSCMTLTPFSTMSKFTLTSFKFSESVILTIAVSCSMTKNLQIAEFPLKLSLILQVPYCFYWGIVANRVTSFSTVFFLKLLS